MSEPKQTMEALVENTGEAPSAGSPEATAKKEKKKPVRGNKRKKKIKKILLWVLIILAVLAFISYKMGFFGGNTGMQNTETYNTFSVVRRDIQNVLTGTGTLAPADSYTVTALASGEITEDYFEEGDVVAKDQLLMKMDSESLVSSLETCAEQL